MCLYVTCYIVSNVWARPPCFHINVSCTICVHARVHTLKDGCLRTFWLTKTCLCVPFNIWHHVCHQISHRRSRNDVQPHELTYEPFSLCNFSHMKSCLRTQVWPTRKTVMRVHCEKTFLYATFWLTWTCPHANFFHRRTCRIKLVTISFVCARPTCIHAVCRLRDGFMRVFTH